MFKLMNEVNKKFEVLTGLQMEMSKRIGKTSSIRSQVGSGKTAAVLISLVEGRYFFALPTITQAKCMFDSLCKNYKNINVEISTSEYKEKVDREAKISIVIGTPDGMMISFRKGDTNIFDNYRGYIFDEIDQYPPMVLQVMTSFIPVAKEKGAHVVALSATLNNSDAKRLGFKDDEILVYRENDNVKKWKVKFESCHYGAIQSVLDMISNNPLLKVLYICNTIRDMNDVENKLNKEISKRDNINDVKIIMHHAQTTVEERRENEAKLANGDFNIFISNNLVQSSIDKGDIDLVVTMYGDSTGIINQRIGRVNRNMREMTDDDNVNVIITHEWSRAPFISNNIRGSIYSCILDNLNDGFVNDEFYLSQSDFEKVLIEENIHDVDNPKDNPFTPMYFSSEEDIDEWWDSLERQRLPLSLRKIGASFKCKLLNNTTMKIVLRPEQITSNSVNTLFENNFLNVVRLYVHDRRRSFAVYDIDELGTFLCTEIESIPVSSYKKLAEEVEKINTEEEFNSLMKAKTIGTVTEYAFEWLKNMYKEYYDFDKTLFENFNNILKSKKINNTAIKFKDFKKYLKYLRSESSTIRSIYYDMDAEEKFRRYDYEFSRSLYSVENSIKNDLQHVDPNGKDKITVINSNLISDINNKEIVYSKYYDFDSLNIKRDKGCTYAAAVRDNLRNIISYEKKYIPTYNDIIYRSKNLKLTRLLFRFNNNVFISEPILIYGGSNIINIVNIIGKYSMEEVSTHIPPIVVYNRLREELSNEYIKLNNKTEKFVNKFFKIGSEIKFKEIDNNINLNIFGSIIANRKLDNDDCFKEVEGNFLAFLTKPVDEDKYTISFPSSYINFGRADYNSDELVYGFDIDKRFIKYFGSSDKISWWSFDLKKQIFYLEDSTVEEKQFIRDIIKQVNTDEFMEELIHLDTTKDILTAFIKRTIDLNDQNLLIKIDFINKCRKEKYGDHYFVDLNEGVFKPIDRKIRPIYQAMMEFCNERRWTEAFNTNPTHTSRIKIEKGDILLDANFNLFNRKLSLLDLVFDEFRSNLNLLDLILDKNYKEVETRCYMSRAITSI